MTICNDETPYLTMAGAMKLVSAYFQPMADRNTNQAIDLSGARGAAAQEKIVKESMENMNPETNAQAAMGGVSADDFEDTKSLLASVSDRVMNCKV